MVPVGARYEELVVNAIMYFLLGLLVFLVFTAIVGKFQKEEDKVAVEAKEEEEVSMSSSESIEEVPQPKPKPKRMTREERKWMKIQEDAKDFFKDQWTGLRDYTHLDMFEAEEKLERLKARGEWLEDNVYYQLRSIANGNEYLTAIPEELDGCSGDILYKWYREQFEAYRGRISTRLMKEIGRRLKPYHEPILLEALKEVSPENVKDWVTEKKHEGFFFSTKAYTACRKLFLSQFEKPKPKEPAKPRKQKKTVVDKFSNRVNFAVKGTSYREPAEIEAAAMLKIGDTLILEPDPDNPYDKYAMRVLTTDNIFIGHVEKQYSKQFCENNVSRAEITKITDDDIPFIYANAMW